MRTLRLPLWLLACLATPALLRAQDEPAKPAAAVPSTFRSLVVVDNRFPPKVNPPKEPADRDPRDRTNKLHCFVCEHGLNPTVAVFTRAAPAADGPGAKLAAALNTLQGEKATRGRFGSFVVFLTLNAEFNADDERTPTGEFTRDDKAKQVRDLGAQLKLTGVPLGLAAKSPPGAAEWGITDADETVVVVYNQMRVVKRFAFAAGQVDEAAVKSVADAAKGAFGK